MAEFPKTTHAQNQGETGVWLVSLAVSKHLKWIFRRTHTEHDYGIDGYIDLVESDGSVTGKSISVQIKCGPSYLKGDKHSISYHGEQKHLNYLINHPTETLLIVCDPASDVCYWEFFDPARTEPTKTGWRIEIPRSNQISSSAAATIRQRVGLNIDHTEALQAYWALNSVISDAGAIIFTISRQSIESKDASEITSFFSRLYTTRAFALSNRSKVILHVYGYDDDERELWEIQEVRDFFSLAEPLVKYWFFFLKGEPSMVNSVKLLACLVCPVTKVDAPTTQVENVQLLMRPDDIVKFIERNFLWLNEFTDRFGFSLKVNKELSTAAFKALQ